MKTIFLTLSHKNRNCYKTLNTTNITETELTFNN